jgi:hypothetical protein
MVGHTGKYGFQTIEIDGSLITQDCFYFKIEYGDQEICTQHVRKPECDNSIEIEGIYDDYDCWNNYYKESKFGFFGSENFEYSNKMYLNGSVKYFGSSISESSIIDTLRFESSELVAAFQSRYIIYKILKAKTIIIEGEEWANKKSNVITVRERSSMFLPILEFENEFCGLTTGNCK